MFLVMIISVSASAQAAAGQNSLQSAAAQEAVRLSQQVVTLFQQKKYAEALPIAKKVIEIREREFGKTHISVAQSYRNLAYIQLQLGKEKEAAGNFENAFDIYEKNRPLSAADEKTFAELLEVVATNQAVSGNFDKAEKNFQRAVELREKLNGTDDIVTADALTRLADLYQATGEYEKAAPLLLRALDIKVKKLGSKNEAADDVFQRVSCTLNKLGRKDEADKLENKLYPPEPDDVPISHSGIVNGKAIRLITPPYPAEAKPKRVSGKVNVKVTINETGKVIHACAIDGAKELQRASESAAYLSTFSPTTINKKPVKVTGIIVYNFIAQ
ncbi:MAG: tetratricopeptide repeat protein [Pyrinomonadaceae bacterium]